MSEYDSMNRYVLSLSRKVAKDGADVTSGGSPEPSSLDAVVVSNRHQLLRLRRSQSQPFSVKLHLRDGWTGGQTRTATTSMHRDRRRHAVSMSLRLVDRVKTQTDGQTDGQTPEIEFGTF